MATFIRVGNRGINLDQVCCWSYTLPSPDKEAQIWVRFAGGHEARFSGLAADGLLWRLTVGTADAEEDYMAYWSGQAARAAARVPLPSQSSLAAPDGADDAWAVYQQARAGHPACLANDRDVR
jgi:hypothetical protein